MKRPLLLDTCAFLWLGQGQHLAPAARAAIAEAQRSGDALASAITAWEIGLLVSRGRIALRKPALPWFESVLAQGVALAPLEPAVLIESSSLPGSIHPDPADRIIAATARFHGYRVVTRDRALLAYGEQGHLAVLAC